MFAKKKLCVSFIFMGLLLIVSNLYCANVKPDPSTLLIEIDDTFYEVPDGSDKLTPSNYADFKNWLSLPKKSDLTKKVDVFFVYPTSWRANGNYPVSDIDNKEMRKWAKYYLKFHASVFETIGNIFAPYYRQLDAQFAIKTNPKQAYEYFKGVPKADIMEAFDYYIKNFNNGRPFILLGHSQGSIMIIEILADYMKANPEVYKKMIAAYAIGVPISKSYYLQNPHLKPANNATDIGVIISYNTEATVVDGVNPFSNRDNVLINPISWKISDEYVAKENNLGSIYVNKDWEIKEYKHIADARINLSRGTIICSTVKREIWSSELKSRSYLPIGVLHENDILLYYYSLRKNAQDRTDSYFGSQIQ
jgi:hypothetical protein